MATITPTSGNAGTTNVTVTPGEYNGNSDKLQTFRFAINQDTYEDLKITSKSADLYATSDENYIVLNEGATEFTATGKTNAKQFVIVYTNSNSRGYVCQVTVTCGSFTKTKNVTITAQTGKLKTTISLEDVNNFTDNNFSVKISGIKENTGIKPVESTLKIQYNDAGDSISFLVTQN